MSSLISPENNIAIFAIIAGAATFGIISEYKKWFGKISGILVTMISMSVLSMTGVVPVASNPKYNVDVYNMVFDYFVPLSIPLLLFSSNIIRIIKESGKLLIAYIVGAVGIVIGCLIAFSFIDLGHETGKTAGVIAATLIGGSVNFVATAEILNFSTNPLFTATVAIDNFVANLYILFLFLIPSISFLGRFFYKSTKSTVENTVDETAKKDPITLENISLVLFIAAITAGAGKLIAPYLQNLMNTELNLSILIITILAIVVANIFPQQLKKTENASFSIGLWMMYVFLATIGAATNLHDILKIGLPVLAFYIVIMLIHFLFLLALARLFRLNIFEVIISSAANIMGPSVAAPMAASLGRKELVTPGILVGIMGYVIGTFVGITIASVLG